MRRAGTGEVAKVRTWIHEDGTSARKYFCLEAYHGDLGGSSGWICIVERNTVSIWSEWHIDWRRGIVEDIRELCTLRGCWSICARLPLDGAVRRLALSKVLGKGGRMGEDHCGCNARKYCEHTDAYCCRCRRRRRCLYCHRRNGRTYWRLGRGEGDQDVLLQARKPHGPRALP